MFGWFKPKVNPVVVWDEQMVADIYRQIECNGARMRRGKSFSAMSNAIIQAQPETLGEVVDLVNAYMIGGRRLPPPVIQRYAPWAEFI